jgi:hypothetical protein
MKQMKQMKQKPNNPTTTMKQNRKITTALLRRRRSA